MRFFIPLALLLIALFSLAAYRTIKRNRAEVVSAPKPKIEMAAVTLPKPEIREIVGSFQKNQNITNTLLQQGLPQSLISEIVESSRPVYDLARVKAEKLYWLCFTKDGKLRDFRYSVDDEKYLTVYRDEQQNRMIPVMKKYSYETRVETVSSTIDASLFASILDIGEQEQLASDLSDIFGYDIDFNTDIQKGDSFRALIEKKFLDGKFVKYGSIQAATFTNQKKQITGFRFQDENGKAAYYNPQGKALKKSFLKSPLRFTRITSRFSLKRLHPILKIVRPHLGVDYAAPAGTPVQTVGSGVVVSAGRNGESGKMVKIRHTSGYTTMYLHMSRISVKPGVRVGQGDVIGYVGSTGLSSGPHLDFRIQRYGNAINPAKVIFPPAPPVSPALFDRFAAVRDTLAGRIEQPR